MDRLFDRIPRIEGERIVLERLTEADIPALEALAADDEVYRYLPSFLEEKRTKDMPSFIRRIYSGCAGMQGSVILGIFEKPERAFCGLAEVYGFEKSMHRVCIGNRLTRECWGKGIATEAVRLMAEYLFQRTDTRTVTASTMTENRASARVLEKNGFIRTASAVPEDWGLPEPTPADKWSLTDQQPGSL